MQASGQFDYVDLDYRLHTMDLPAASIVSNDPLLGDQWNLSGPAQTVGGANVLQAWSLASGTNPVKVGVIDTGLSAHPELDASRVLPGYDFLSSTTMTTTSDATTHNYLPAGFVKNDGIAARDPDPSDPGDWVSAQDATSYPSLCGTARASGWHGTYVAGLIAAGNNGIGMVGVQPASLVEMLRVLGKCGGQTSDLVDALRWAAGQSVSGITTPNPGPVQVVNLSLGYFGNCGQSLQDAVTAARAAGVTVVAATGNNAASSVGAPANCTGVIGVTAHTAEGDNADYANTGTGTALSAPGGGRGVLITGSQRSVLSLLNDGATTPGNPSYGYKTGTSIATPHVTGVASLLLSINPALTPDDISQLLTQSARPFPVGTYCQQHAGECGAGMLDAAAAVKLLQGQPVIYATASAAQITPGSAVHLTAAGGIGYGQTGRILSWVQTAGPSVALSVDSGSGIDVTLPTAGTYSFRANIYNAASGSASSDVSVVATASASGTGDGSRPSTGDGSTSPSPSGSGSSSSGGGGGGAIGLGEALALLLAGAGAWWSRRGHGRRALRAG
jgi:serine protease